MLWSNMTYLDIREEVLEQVGARVACVEEHQLGFLQMVWGQTFLNVRRVKASKTSPETLSLEDLAIEAGLA